MIVVTFVAIEGNFSANILEEIGYSLAADGSYSKPLAVSPFIRLQASDNGYPRFHASVKEKKDEICIRLHVDIDQHKTYDGVFDLDMEVSAIQKRLGNEGYSVYVRKSWDISPATISSLKRARNA